MRGFQNATHCYNPMGRSGDMDGYLNLYEFNHHCNVNTKAGRLGRWVTTQRSDHKNKKISKGNKAKLDSIGFQWKMLGIDK
eukprot:scaffold6070_cov105-Skeletonema_dohrnii-CCMP3373.AAC.2